MSTKITAAVFPGGFNMPCWTAIEEGFFAKRDLEVDMYYVSASVEQLPGVIHGDWEIGLTGIDNIVAYNNGQGEAEIRTESDLFAFMGGDDAFLRVVTQPDIKTYEDLRGKQLAVDAMTTGFAFVLRKMVEKAGVADDVEFIRAGGVMQRWEALKEGEFAGTLLMTPFELIGSMLGLNLLQSANEVFPDYQGIAGVAKRSWAANNKDTLDNFIAGYLEGLDWLFDPANNAAAIERLVAHVPGMAPELAAKALEIFVSPGGFERNARLNMKGVDKVLELRDEYGEPKRELGVSADYIDTSFYDRVMATRN